MELQQFDSNTLPSFFTQEASLYAENCNDNDTIFYDFFAMNDMNENVGFNQLNYTIFDAY